MATAFPHRTPIDHTPRESTDIVAEASDAADVLSALSSETAQAILNTLDDAPGTASDVADAVDTSLQNAQYHLTRLREANLVESVDTWYSEKGKEMTVYALATERLIVQFGTQSITH